MLTKHPADLKPHPKIKDLARWDTDSPEFATLCDSVKTHGIQVPLIITDTGLIMDGVTRWLAAKRMQVDVPCLIRPEADLVAIVVGSEALRRHHTKSQIAFKFAPLIQEAFEADQARKLAAGSHNLRQGPAPADLCLLDPRVEHYAAELGISYRLLVMANEIHGYFGDFPDPLDLWTDEQLDKVGLVPGRAYTLREVFTRSIMDPEKPAGLGGVKAAIVALTEDLHRRKQFGRAHTGGRPKDEPRQLQLFKTTFKDLTTRFDYWKAFTPDARRDALEAVRSSIERMPNDLLTEMRRALAAELKRRAEGEAPAVS